MLNMLRPEYEVVRDKSVHRCRICERQCANGVHRMDEAGGVMLSDSTKCVCCRRCVCLCPAGALKIVKTDHTFRESGSWKGQTLSEIYRQAESGGVAALLHGQSQGVPQLLRPHPDQRLPGDQPLHRSPPGGPWRPG